MLRTARAELAKLSDDLESLRPPHRETANARPPGRAAPAKQGDAAAATGA